MAQVERRLDKNRLDSFFLQYAKDITSQGGEDGILAELFRLLSVDSSFVKYCIDIGAWDGKHLSNTYTLLNDQGWEGLMLEAEGSRCAELQRLYADKPGVHCLQRLVSLEGEDSLASILQAYQAPSSPGFLCIDIDGADYHLWRSVADSCRAAVVCIEFNPTIPNDVFFVQAAQIEIQQGSSLLAIAELGQSLGYTLVVTTTFNAIFVRSDLCHLLPQQLLHQDIHRLHLPYMATEVFQTYDGELKYVGMKKLLWHKIPLNPQKLQMLAKKDRKYPFAPSTTASYQGDFDDVIDQFVQLNEQSIFPKEAFKSLFALRQLPIIEGIATALLQQLVFHQVGIWSQPSPARERHVAKEGVELVELIVENAIRLMQADVHDALRILTVAKNCVCRLQAMRTDAAAKIGWLLLSADIEIHIAKCNRMEGDYFSSWNALLASSQSLEEASRQSRMTEEQTTTVMTLQAANSKEAKKCAHFLRLEKVAHLYNDTTTHTSSNNAKESISSNAWRWVLAGVAIGAATTSVAMFVWSRRR